MASRDGVVIPFPAPAGEPLDVEDTLTELVPIVRRWMWRLLGPRPDFDDAVQDALVELARALPRFEGRSSVTTYAHPIVVRTAYRYMGSREAPAADVDRLRSGDDPERRAAQRQQLERLHRVLSRLPDKQRVAFVLCAVERVSHARAAELEGVSIETLRARLKRARAELARRLRADPELRARLTGPKR